MKEMEKRETILKGRREMECPGEERGGVVQAKVKNCQISYGPSPCSLLKHCTGIHHALLMFHFRGQYSENQLPLFNKNDKSGDFQKLQ